MTAHTFTVKKDTYAQFLLGTAGFAQTATKVLQTNGNRLIQLAQLSKPVLDLVSQYSIVLECLPNGLTIFDRTRLEQAFAGGELHIDLIPVGDRGAYTAADRPTPNEFADDKLPPNCYGLPYDGQGIHPVDTTIRSRRAPTQQGWTARHRRSSTRDLGRTATAHRTADVTQPRRPVPPTGWDRRPSRPRSPTLLRRSRRQRHLDRPERPAGRADPARDGGEPVKGKTLGAAIKLIALRGRDHPRHRHPRRGHQQPSVRCDPHLHRAVHRRDRPARRQRRQAGRSPGRHGEVDQGGQQLRRRGHVQRRQVHPHDNRDRCRRPLPQPGGAALPVAGGEARHPCLAAAHRTRSSRCPGPLRRWT